MTERWENALPCVLNNLGECLAKTPEACQCRQMAKDVYEDAARTRRNDVMQWRPMSEMTEQMKYNGGYLLHAPDLVHEDFNPEGVERGYWQDGEGWKVPGWDANNDVWTEGMVVNPTHFAVITKP
jgi:hypothetical protein